MSRFITIAIAVVSFSTLATAETKRDLGSHEHGAAMLNIAIEDESVFIELDTPWNNLVGFEHAPSNNEQHALVDDALVQLNTPEQLFSFVGADCVAQETTLENNLADNAEDEHRDDKTSDDDHGHNEEQNAHGEEKEHEHEEVHDGDKNDEHAEDESHDEEHHDDDEAHASVLALYTFNCTNLNSISAIEIGLLDVWSGFESLSAQLIGPGGQTSVEVNANQTTVDVSKIR